MQEYWVDHGAGSNSAGGNGARNGGGNSPTCGNDGNSKPNPISMMRNAHHGKAYKKNTSCIGLKLLLLTVTAGRAVTKH